MVVEFLSHILVFSLEGLSHLPLGHIHLKTQFHLLPFDPDLMCSALWIGCIVFGAGQSLCGSDYADYAEYAVFLRSVRSVNLLYYSTENK